MNSVDTCRNGLVVRNVLYQKYVIRFVPPDVVIAQVTTDVDGSRPALRRRGALNFVTITESTSLTFRSWRAPNHEECQKANGEAVLRVKMLDQPYEKGKRQVSVAGGDGETGAVTANGAREARLRDPDRTPLATLVAAD
ncbi:hypothetical protein EVAR_4210_1 [Eumeta japonica]|uniref:Uncharacterized protein n=1 Tax=Eumeta variegata TaxID=151549 RepID=A0A4C1TGX6_EUMVA|nr:hypothetical protein EVAR_4210_1 [Eumeta japonica]